MTIRPEIPADFPVIRAILLAAFANEPHSRQTEGLIVEELRAAGALTIGLVAQEEGVAGGWYMLGPVAVEPSRQRKGIGAALIREGLRQLGELGARGCVLVGHPGYYGRFGFKHSETLGMEGVPAEVFFCLPLRGEEPRGVVTHHEAFMAGM